MADRGAVVSVALSETFDDALLHHRDVLFVWSLDLKSLIEIRYNLGRSFGKVLRLVQNHPLKIDKVLIL